MKSYKVPNFRIVKPLEKPAICKKWKTWLNFVDDQFVSTYTFLLFILQSRRSHTNAFFLSVQITGISDRRKSATENAKGKFLTFLIVARKSVRVLGCCVDFELKRHHYRQLERRNQSTHCMVECRRNKGKCKCIWRRSTNFSSTRAIRWKSQVIAFAGSSLRLRAVAGSAIAAAAAVWGLDSVCRSASKFSTKIGRCLLLWCEFS